MVTIALAASLAGCATPPPEPSLATLPPAPLPAPVAACPACLDQGLEIARLRQELAAREAQILDLRASQRDQAKVIQESTREATRAKARARRLGTQADAASYLAEVEVALGALKASLGTARPPLLPLAESLVEGASAPFAQGDYAEAMNRAAQAEQVIAIVADLRAAPTGRAPAPEVLLQLAIPLRLASDARLRREPRPASNTVAMVAKGTPIVASAYRGSWMRVATEDGRIGWVGQSSLAAR